MGGSLVALADLEEHLLAQHRGVRRETETQTHRPAAHLHHPHLDRVVDDHGLACATVEIEHGRPPLVTGPGCRRSVEVLLTVPWRYCNPRRPQAARRERRGMIQPRATLFDLISARSAWLGQRQAVLGQNVANADTPGSRPRD